MAHRLLVQSWLSQPYVAQWFYGEGLANTLKHLDDFLDGRCPWDYWLAYDKEHPFAFLITSSVNKPGDDISRWCSLEGAAITLDLLIGDKGYLGRGLAHTLIQEFLLSQFSEASEVLIDPEATNTKAVHVYEKAGFEIVGEFVPSHSPAKHYMMRLNMQKLRSR